MSEGPEGALRSWSETFQAQSRWDVLPLWRVQSPHSLWPLMTLGACTVLTGINADC